MKYRRKIITHQKEQFLKDLVQEIARDKGFTVHLFEAGEMDHIHCFVSAPPKIAVTDIVKYLKGITGRKLFEVYPDKVAFPPAKQRETPAADQQARRFNLREADGTFLTNFL